MAGSGNNVTTQWTFRDGRDYVFSLTTTETPNTVSFLISDKITGEEWTGCYDENSIEVITKRTGCFKSLSVFLAMIKSALLKKSDSVVLDLLNVEDLAAISLHRQSTLADAGGKIPVNFQLYNDEINGNPIVGIGTSTSLNHNIKSHQLSDTGNGITSTNNRALLTKRKYLIVTYVAEFDKVHYPLPLNYSSPPDLTVMQNNIMKLKAEVTSLKSTKFKLENELDSIKSTCKPHSHENNGMKTDTEILTNTTNPHFHIKLDEGVAATDEDRMVEAGVDVDCEETCKKSSKTMADLQSKVHDLEDAISFQRNEHMQAMEKLENENHFLRHKIEAAEKYELELWSQIQKLKEKVARTTDLDKEMKAGARKDNYRNRFHVSRHDNFYQSGNSPASTSVQSTCTRAKNSSLAKKLENGKQRNIIGSRTFTKNNIRPPSNRLHDPKQSKSGSRSNSTGSYCSADAVISAGHVNLRQITRQSNVSNSRSRSISSAYKNLLNKSRHSSLSPSRSRFDPTTYIVDKKQKQSRMASLRLQRIEARIRSGSRSRPSSALSPSKRVNKKITKLTNDNDVLCERIGDSHVYSPSFKERFERKSYAGARKIDNSNSRPCSAESGATVILAGPRYTAKRIYDNPRNRMTSPFSKDIKRIMEQKVRSPGYPTEISNRLRRSSPSKTMSVNKSPKRTLGSTNVTKVSSHSYHSEIPEKLISNSKWSNMGSGYTKNEKEQRRKSYLNEIIM